MTELAHSTHALQALPFPGRSQHDSMLDTDADEHAAARPPDVDTLSAQDGVADASLDERLLHRDLKARIFGAEGQVRIGRYEVLRRIGRGGMGTVYVALDPQLDRKVALKVLRADRTRGRERMLQEARALAKLTHPNVVTVHEVGLHDDRVFVAMELVEGKTLRAWLEAQPSRAELYEVFVQAARGLRAAHRAGLVHRDFKPENVLIGADGRVRVVDFGVAKASDSLDSSSLDSSPPSPGAKGPAGLALVPAAAGQPSLTLTGQLLGTPAYMAPEQFLGASVDARTDVFAFCVALYEALMGRRPFDGDDTSTVATSVLQGQARPLAASHVPPALVALVQQGLRREPGDRPASLDGLIRTLETALAPGQPRRFRRVRVAAAMLSLAGLGGGLAMMSAGAGDPPPPEPVAAASVVATDAAEDEAEVAAFAELTAATSDDERLAAAQSYLERFGTSGSEVHRAIAHSVAGDVQWRRSCDQAVDGLCIEEQPIQPAGNTCSTATRGSILKRQRAAVLTEPAQAHLQAAMALAGVSVSREDPLSRPFAEAIARARVQLADAELERYLTLEVPPELDFDNAMVLSKVAFEQFYTQLVADGQRHVQTYAAVKQHGDPRWTLVAAARTGMIAETALAGVVRTPMPRDLTADEHREYCEALQEYRAAPPRMAHDAYAYCVEKADTYGLGDEPIVAFCRARLELFPETVTAKP